MQVGTTIEKKGSSSAASTLREHGRTITPSVSEDAVYQERRESSVDINRFRNLINFDSYEDIFASNATKAASSDSSSSSSSSRSSSKLDASNDKNLQELVVFPSNDVTVVREQRIFRTKESTVPVSFLQLIICCIHVLLKCRDYFILTYSIERRPWK